MKITRLTAFFAIALSILAASADAQRRRPAPRPTPKPTPVRNTVNPVVSTAKQQVTNQLHNVNVFVDKIGPIAVAIESADKEAAARRLSREAAAANESNKQKIIAAISGLRSGLVKLESDFRTKPLLAQYLSKIQGISNLAADAEDSAIAGRFVASKDPLREVALKLNDTLVVLPGPLAPGSVTPTRAGSGTTVPTRTVSNTSPSSGGSTGRRDPAVGMTIAEVTNSSWGVPTNKRTSTSANGTTEVWTYSGKGTVYFFNGKVTQVLR